MVEIHLVTDRQHLVASCLPVTPKNNNHMFNKIKQIKDLRNQAKTMQNALAEVVVVGQAAGGKVMVTIDGNQQVHGVQIADGMEKAAIESAVKDAINDAFKKLQKELAVKMKDLGGLDFFKNLGM